MKCPYCDNLDDKVVDSRSAAGGEAVRRRRECISCGKRYTTYEYIERSGLQIIKQDGNREDFNRGKLINGISLACKKRPVSREIIEKTAEEIESVLHESSKSEVSSRKIGELVMEKLRELDEVAYIRFASVYRNFRDRGEFIEELRGLPTDLKVIKSSGEKQPFDRNKIMAGIKLACNKRPFTGADIERMTDTIVNKLKPNEKDEISSIDIGKHVAEKLKKTDEVAYVRFASVYRKFKDKTEFLNELKELLGE
ncbi:MAG: transcriptional repressor NrdR [candidate division Zixibacteria bacterium]|nr:transcriptional repressor NrdR [candidate division Zixibacteria bacterium]